MREINNKVKHRILKAEKGLNYSSIDINNTNVKSISQLIDILQFNQFITIYDIEINDYIFHYNLSNVLGYKPLEFTEYNFNNQYKNETKSDVFKPITFELDLPHFQRFACILYMLISSPGIQITPWEDYAVFNFRMYNKNGEIVLVNYKTFCHETNAAGNFKTHLDLWTVEPFESENVFFPSAKFISMNQQEKINKTVDEIKEKIYGFQLTKTEKRVFSLLSEGYSRKLVAEKMYISDGTVNTHFNNVKDKINAYLLHENETPLSSFLQLVNYVKLYQLL